MKTLYVTSSRKGQTEQQLRHQPYAGALFALDVGVRGTETALFNRYPPE